MSTCQGAPAPHEDCPHGDACDWQPSETTKILTTLAMLGSRSTLFEDTAPTNRAERRRAARRKR